MHIIRLKGLTKWAKKRIKQHGRGAHGDEFLVLSSLSSKILVQSIDNSWKLKAGVYTSWAGWVILEKEAIIIQEA